MQGFPGPPSHISFSLLLSISEITMKAKPNNRNDKDGDTQNCNLFFSQQLSSLGLAIGLAHRQGVMDQVTRSSSVPSAENRTSFSCLQSSQMGQNAGAFL